jgi:hypothetical protein
MRRRPQIGLLVILLAALIQVSPSAQRITRRIFIAATAGGAPVPDLTAADFAVVENGTKREITRAALAKAPMRIVLMIDSSTAVAQMLNHIRPALTTFLDALPPEHEVVFVSTGGQMRIRTPMTTDRARLKTDAGRFASEGGANSFVDALLEADRRFLKPSTQWPVFVIVTTDNGESRGQARIEEYNRFLADFLLRGGSAHGVVVRGTQTSHISDIAENLIQNTGGIYDYMNQSTALEAQLKKIAERLGADHRKLADAYEIDFTSDAKIQSPSVEVTATRPNIAIRLYPRRSF